MATFVAIRNKKQTKGAMLNVLKYVLQEKKIEQDGVYHANAQDCTITTCYLEMMATKERYDKTDGRQFFHFVQSFAAEDNLTPGEVNEIGLEFAARQFPGHEVVVATHCDTGHLHNHFVVNSVNWQSGKKLHQSPDTLREHRQVNDKICHSHGLQILPEPDKEQRKKRMDPGEYQAALRGDSWKFRLINAIDEALERSISREDFIENMEYEGYSVRWTDSRKYITYTTPEGMKCRDNNLHDETYLKENLERLFAWRQQNGFVPGTPEPPQGWLADTGSVMTEVVRLGKTLEQMGDAPPLPAPRTHIESKLLHREQMKQLALGQKPQGEQEQKYELTF